MGYDQKVMEMGPGIIFLNCSLEVSGNFFKFYLKLYLKPLQRSTILLKVRLFTAPCLDYITHDAPQYCTSGWERVQCGSAQLRGASEE